MRSTLDMEIWDAICAVFPAEKPFTLEEAVEVARKGVGKIRVLPYDYAVGRVLGALTRVQAISQDIEELSRPGGYIWHLLPTEYGAEG